MFGEEREDGERKEESKERRPEERKSGQHIIGERMVEMEEELLPSFQTRHFSFYTLGCRIRASLPLIHSHSGSYLILHPDHSPLKAGSHNVGTLLVEGTKERFPFFFPDCFLLTQALHRGRTML